MKQFRLRMTDVELKFLIKVLGETVEGADLVLAFSTRENKFDSVILEQRRRKFVAREMQRKFRSILEGKKRHMRNIALIVCAMLEY